MTDLAGQAKLSYDNLGAAIKRLNQDRQVQTIWSLYHNFTELGGGREYAKEYNSDPDRNNREAASHSLVFIRAQVALN